MHVVPVGSELLTLQDHFSSVSELIQFITRGVTFDMWPWVDQLRLHCRRKSAI